MANKTNTTKRKTTAKKTQQNHTKTTKRQPKEYASAQPTRFGDTILDEVILLCIIVLSAVAALSQITERMGLIGNLFRSFFQGLFGFGGLLLPLCIIAYCIWMLVSEERKWMVVRACGGFLLILILSAGAYLFHPSSQQTNIGWLQKCTSFYADGALSNGGLLGGLFGDTLLRMFDALGSIVILLTLLIIAVVMITGKSFFGTVGVFAENQKTRHQERKERIRQEMEQLQEAEQMQYEMESVQKVKRRNVVSEEKQLQHVHRRKPAKEGFNIELEETGYAQERPRVQETVFQHKKASISIKKREPIYDFVKDSGDFTEKKVKDTHTSDFEEMIQDTPTIISSPIPPTEAKILSDTIYPQEMSVVDEIPEQIPEQTMETTDSIEDIPIFTSTIDEMEPILSSIETEPILEPIQNEYIQTEQKTEQELDQKPELQKSNTEELEDLDTEEIVPEVEEKPYEFPPLSLLGQDPGANNTGNKAEMIETAKKLEHTLKSFGVDAKVVQINKGPTVTRYEVSPSQGVKVSKIVNLADDIALNLAANGIRIEAPIPGKAAVGIEVPNRQTDSVYLRTVLESEAFENHPSKLAFALGVDIAGNPVVTDIAKMPHLLIAGATGSGKSVCINTLITSILYKATPKEVKLLLVDPKVVELSVYNGIPHLLIPVVTDPKKASAALNWAVREMLQRYNSFAACGVRDMKGFNKQKEEQGEPEAKMSQIVIIIDELADLMMAASGEVEDAICRLAQMARAAGMHLIIATQRPSVDVITGVIKANIPSRMAFAVSSGIDSRTILDTVGAEKLLGKGDMLFYPSGQSKPARMQGAFVTDEEVESIVDFLRKNAKPTYTEEMVAEITTSAQSGGIDGGEVDEFYEQAVELIIEKKKASVSMLQRQFRIGYNRAARLMEDLEKRGMVGPEDGSKPRKVLITAAQWDELRGITTETDADDAEE